VLHVETEPPGASVKVNGDVRGVTPLDVGGLPLGDYEVKLELKGFEPKTNTLSLTESAPKADVKVTLPRVAPVLANADLLSTPFGAAVTVDGKPAGQTPVTDLRVAPGTHQVQMAKEGYEAWAGLLKVESGKRGRLDVTLKAIPAPAPSATPAVDPNHVYQNTLGEVDILARQISGSPPDYPTGKAPKLRSGDSVSVSYEMVVDDRGEIESIKVTESAGKVVDDAVLNALKKYKFSPAVKQGIKVKVLLRGRQTFRMG
jgi:TonB family protein